MTHYVARSDNRKVGSAAVTYRERDTCPNDCPLLAAGCYAAGRLESHARYGRGRDDWADRAIAETPRRSFFRHLIVGDLLRAGTATLDRDYADGVERLTSARRDVLQHGFTHAHRIPEVADWVRKMMARGVVFSASCETVQDAYDASRAGLLPVLTLTGPDDDAIGQIVDGRRVIVCANQTNGVTCAQCTLCARVDTPEWRRPIIGWLPHSGGARAAVRAVQRARASA